MRKVTCRCESVFDADLPETIDLDAGSVKRKALIDDILGGTFFQVSCPACGAILKPELRVRIVSKSEGLDLTLIPELDRMALYRGVVELPKGGQVLVGFGELFERARIMADSLDPEVVEILKYWLLAKAEESAPEALVSVSFAGIEGGKLRFHLAGLKEGEVAVLQVGRDLYDKTLAEKTRSLRAAPFDRIFGGPYRSIRILESEDE